MTVFGVRVDCVDQQEGLIGLGLAHLPDLRLFASWSHLAACLAEYSRSAHVGQERQHAAQAWSFAHEIVPGDLLAVIMAGSDRVRFAEASGSYSCRTGRAREARHQRRVVWLTMPIALDELEPDLRHSLRSLALVRRIRSTNAEERLWHFIRQKGGVRAAGSGSVAPVRSHEAIPHAHRDLADLGRDAIRARIRSRYWGLRCERLVEAILSAEGYDVLSVGPGPDGGLDLIAGSGPLGFGADRLAVQIKAGNRAVTPADLAGFDASMLRSGAGHGLVVSLAGFRGLNVRATSRGGFRMRLWDEEALLDAVLKVYERMPDAIRRDLPLKRVWVPDFA